MLRHPEPKVSILRDGVVLFNPVAVSNFMLLDGQMVLVFYDGPAQCLFFRQLRRGAAGGCLKTNAKGTVVAEKQQTFSKDQVCFPETMTYASSRCQRGVYAFQESPQQ